MPEKHNSQNPKLETYLLYGIIFGMLGGVLISLLGIITDILFFKAGGFGVGLSLGVLAGVLLHSAKTKQ